MMSEATLYAMGFQRVEDVERTPDPGRQVTRVTGDSQTRNVAS